MEKFLIVGLGNIGIEYAHTRHNIGFDVADAFVKKHSGIWQVGRLAEYATIKLKGRQISLIKPTTYMNRSGQAFNYWLQQEKVPVAQTLTIVDDLALPLEKIRIRAGGSDAGHNGLKDIQAVLGTNVYPKLRFGIGNQFARGKQVDFVLGKWTMAEQPVIDEKINACVNIIEHFALVGLESAMSTFNSLKFNL